tara:strand:+ start:6268 stop:6984 length:717 start_codon:yes stop_codon:yes gene_type:complete
MNFKFLPNLITLFNLFLGCIVILLLVENNLEVKYVFIISSICLVLDYLDGFIARKLNAKSEIGLQLDSLADLVSFGLVPGILLYNMFNEAPSSSVGSISSSFIPFIGFLVTLCSAYRLARFNIRKSSADYFLGLATPLNAVLIYSISIISFKDPFYNQFIRSYEFLIPFTMFSSITLVSNLKLINFKFLNFHYKGNRARIFLIFSSIPLLFFLKINAVPIIFMIYILTSVLKFYVFRN